MGVPSVPEEYHEEKLAELRAENQRLRAALESIRLEPWAKPQDIARIAADALQQGTDQ